jgi:hypothetical protein
MKRFTKVVLTSLVGLGLFAGCGPDNAPQSRNRGDLRVVVLPEDTDPARSASYDFGEVPAGTSKKVTLRLRNVGPDEVVVTATRYQNAPTGAFFAQPPAMIESDGGEGDLVVTFQPPAAGDYSGELIIEHSGESLSSSVNLTGKGI